MDPNHAIERHRQPLLTIIAGLFAMIGLTEGGIIVRLKLPLYRKVLALLRPAESAVRRLIMVAARDLKLKPLAARPVPKRPIPSGNGKGPGKRRRSFPLFDRRVNPESGWRYGAKRPKVEPRIHFLGDDSHLPPYLLYRPPAPQSAPKPASDGAVSAASLCRRLDAIKRALENLPHQAKRYARWRAKPLEARRPKLHTPLRPGPPPGLNRKSTHEVHEILKECHWLARSVPAADTS